MERRFVGILLAAALSFVGFTTPAFAATSAIQATDPSANSPAGTIYSIPLDSARQDASPHGHGHSGSSGSGGGLTGGGGPSSGGGGTGSTGGGTGSTGGGTGTGGAGSASNGSGANGSNAVTAKSKPVLVPGGQPGSLVHSSNGFGSSSQVPDLNSTPGAGLGALQNNASSAPLLALVLAIVVLVVGGYVGSRAWRTAATRGELPAGPASEATASRE